MKNIIKGAIVAISAAAISLTAPAPASATETESCNTYNCCDAGSLVGLVLSIPSLLASGILNDSLDVVLVKVPVDVGSGIANNLLYKANIALLNNFTLVDLGKISDIGVANGLNIIAAKLVNVDGVTKLLLIGY